ncbi:MAG: hypothetical protein ACLPSW_21505 [Roseiarcus sp.]
MPNPAGAIAIGTAPKLPSRSFILGPPVQIDDGSFFATTFPGFPELMREPGAEVD